MGQTIKIGTSGWSYQHWKGLFFPAGYPQSKWLEFYCDHFDTVELNASFYRLPNFKTFENWNARTPEHFLWAIKASKYITHTKRLKEPEEPLGKFYATSSGLKEKLGPILFQLPPNLFFDEKLFQRFCQSLNPLKRHVLEVRHPSWVSDPLFAILESFKVAFCISDTAGQYPFYEAITADFVYIRLHGSQRLYASDYSEKELETWAEKIESWGKDTYVYFDNDFEGYAVKNAIKLKHILGITG